MKLLKCDVAIEPIAEGTCSHQGENCTGGRTHRVTLDCRSIGIISQVGDEYCETCATEIAKELQSSLPEDEDEG